MTTEKKVYTEEEKLLFARRRLEKLEMARMGIALAIDEVDRQIEYLKRTLKGK